MKTQFKSNKHKNIYNSAQDLFWKHGIKKVSVEEICKKAEVSKMTFYKFFSNKTDLAIIILNDKINTSIKRHIDVINSDMPFQEKIKKFFELKAIDTNELSFEFVDDFIHIPELKATYESSKKKVFDLFIDFLKDSQKKGLIRKDIKIEFIIRQLILAHTIMEDEHLLSLYKNPQELAIESMNFIFYGILS